MTMFDSFKPEEFLLVMPTMARDQINAMIVAGVSPENVINLMALEPGDGLATKGGVYWPRELAAQIKEELRILLCTDDKKYADIRSKLSGDTGKAAKTIVLSISTGIAANIGVTAAMCAPLIGLLLWAVARVTLSAWCETVKPKPIAVIQPETSGPGT